MKHWRLSKDIDVTKSTIDEIINYIEDLEYENELLNQKVEELESQIDSMNNGIV